MQTNFALQVSMTGGYSTNVDGVMGSMNERIGAFHCEKCHYDFQANLPALFIPVITAVPVSPPKPPCTNVVVKQMEASYKPIAGKTPIHTVPMPDGSGFIYIYLK
jgi:hypothetical protein